MVASHSMSNRKFPLKGMAGILELCRHHRLSRPQNHPDPTSRIRIGLRKRAGVVDVGGSVVGGEEVAESGAVVAMYYYP